MREQGPNHQRVCVKGRPSGLNELAKRHSLLERERVREREREREREDETKEGRESERIIMAVSKLLQYNRPNPPILTSLGSSFVSAAV